MHDVAILHHIIFSFHIHFASVLAGSFRSQRNIILKLNYFSADESFLEISMNNASALRSILQSA